MSRKVKSVSFNLNDPFENEMYAYSQQYSNFSTFAKRLIQNSMNKKDNQPIQTEIKSVPNEHVKGESQQKINKDYLRQLI